MSLHRVFLLLIVLLAYAAPGQAEIFKYYDSNGNLVLTDAPPKDKAVKAEKIESKPIMTIPALKGTGAKAGSESGKDKTKAINYTIIIHSPEVEAQPLGTGGAIRAALARSVADHVFIFNGDMYLDLEVDELERLWQANRHAVIVVRKVPDTARFGRVEMCDGRINAFLAKGEGGPGLINAGCYVLPKDALDDFPFGLPFSLETGFFIKYMQCIEFDGFVTHGCFIDIGVPDDYALAQTELVGL